jgi:hypothetical protein
MKQISVKKTKNKSICVPDRWEQRVFFWVNFHTDNKNFWQFLCKFAKNLEKFTKLLKPQNIENKENPLDRSFLLTSSTFLHHSTLIG